MKASTLILLFVLAISISVSATTTPSVPDSTVLDTSARHKLQIYYSKEQINQIELYLRAYKSIRTAKDLHVAYQKIEQLKESLASTLSAAEEKSSGWTLEFTWMDTVIPGMSFNRYEGTAVIVNPLLSSFKRKAAATPEKSDDDFMELMIATYGKEKWFAFPAWIQQTWDYGGNSLLGSGTEVKLLGQIQKALDSNKEFEKELKEIRSNILSDVTTSTCYDYSDKEIIAEINKILTSIKLTDDEKSLLVKRRKDFEHPSNELQIDCGHKECRCGG